MKSVKKLHTNAINIAEKAFIAQRQGYTKKARRLFCQALEKEQKAAELLLLKPEFEPSRSILFRSAASLAYNAKFYGLAQELCKKGLSGYPPEDIKNELTNLLKEIKNE